MTQLGQVTESLIAHLEKVLYTANAHTTRGRENGTARTDACRLDIKLSPAAVSSILIFTASWK